MLMKKKLYTLLVFLFTSIVIVAQTNYKPVDKELYDTIVYLDNFFVIPIFKPVLIIGKLPIPTPLRGIFI